MGSLSKILESREIKVDEESALENSVILELNERITKLEQLYEEFAQTQSAIETICDEGDVEGHYAERDEFENKYYGIIARAKSLIENKKEMQLDNTSEGSVATKNSEIWERFEGVNTNNVRLPKFGGFYENWLEFRDTFTSIIHNNRNLSNIQKLHYLRSSLHGQAAEIIKALEVCDTNYQVAWKLLCERYDNKKILVNNHVKALFNLPTIKNETAIELRKLCDDLTKHILSLDVLQQPIKEWSALMIYLVTTKLDNQTKREWETSLRSKNTESADFPTIEDMKTFLNGRCELLETLDSQNNRKERTINQGQFIRKRESSTISLATAGEKRNVCEYCDSK